MTLDKFGRHITHKRDNRIYLIQDKHDVVTKDLLDHNIRSSADSLKFMMNKRLQDIRQELDKSMELAESRLKDKILSSLTDKINLELRCVLFLPFTATGGTDRNFYTINGLQPHIDIPVDCKVIFIKADHSIDVRYATEGRYWEAMPITALAGRMLVKGSTIKLVRTNVNIGRINALLILQYVPWNNTPTFQ